MFTVISPAQFKTTPWKNGQGETTELAISPGGTLTEFDWRISMATVLNHGPFSDFSGYHRHLVLLEGNGIELTHDESTVDVLQSPLSVASFDGSYATVGHLLAGPIQDFNVMTKQNYFAADIKTVSQHQAIQYHATNLNFVYATKATLQIQIAAENIDLPKDHLLQLSEHSNQIKITGEGFIAIELNKI